MACQFLICMDKIGLSLAPCPSMNLLVTNARKPESFVSRQVETSRLFFLEPEENEDLAVVFGGFERCRTDYRIDRRNFPWFSLEFVNRGSGFLRLNDIDHKLGPGSIFLYGPAQPHRIESSPESPLGKYFVGFTGRRVMRFLDRYGVQPGMVARCPKGEPMRRAFDMLIDRGVRKSPLAGPLCALITKQLLLMCRDDAVPPVNTDSPAFAAYSRARDLIEERFLELSSLQAVAAACGLEAPYLCRLFARYHDESPYQFLTRLRMDHASRLLLEDDASVKSVAHELAFKDAFHFSRVFKSVHHVPPSRFRQSAHPRWTD
jgi:AraC-like DNA-binding protein